MPTTTHSPDTFCPRTLGNAYLALAKKEAGSETLVGDESHRLQTLRSGLHERALAMIKTKPDDTGSDAHDRAWMKAVLTQSPHAKDQRLLEQLDAL